MSGPRTIEQMRIPLELARREGATVETPWGRIEQVDDFLAPLVEALNAIPNVRTVDCCSGHGSDDALVNFTAVDGDISALAQTPFMVALCSHLREWQDQPGHRSLQYCSMLVPSSAADNMLRLRFYAYERDEAKPFALMFAERDVLVALCNYFREVE